MKKLLLPLLAVLLITACKKEVVNSSSKEGNAEMAAKSSRGKLDVCHYDATSNTWRTINISINALPAHLAHGDVRLDDQDGDGYVPTNSCGYTGIKGMGDCNDTNAAINPGATEICSDGIDNNCNGQIDENCMPAVKIGNQVWMQKNLDVARYRNGATIMKATTAAEWIAAANAGIGAWCYYNNDSAIGVLYGKLYNWYAINDPRGLSPAGWHVPSDAEWTALENYLGSSSSVETAGISMKATSGWNFGGNGTNTSGFTALPGGGRNYDGSYSSIGNFGFWWSSTETNFNGNDGEANTAWLRGLSYFSGYFPGDVYRGYSSKGLSGISVRCLRD